MNTRQQSRSLAIDIEGRRDGESNNFRTNQFYQDQDRALFEAERAGRQNRTALREVRFAGSLEEGNGLLENGNESLGMDNQGVLENQGRPEGVGNQINGVDAQRIGEGIVQMQGQIQRVLDQLQAAERDRLDFHQRFSDLLREASRWHDDIDKFAKMTIGIDFRENCLDQRIQNLLRTQELLTQGVDNCQRRLGDLSREQSGRAWVDEGHFCEIVQEIAGLKGKLTSVWSEFQRRVRAHVDVSAQVGSSVFNERVDGNAEPRTPSAFSWSDETNMRSRNHGITQNDDHVNSQRMAGVPPQNLVYDGNTDSQNPLRSGVDNRTQRTPVTMSIVTPSELSRETQVLTVEGSSGRIRTSTPVCSGGVPFPLSLSTIQKWQAEEQERHRGPPPSYRSEIPINHFGLGATTNPGGVIEGGPGGLCAATNTVVTVNTKPCLGTASKAPGAIRTDPTKFFLGFFEARSAATWGTLRKCRPPFLGVVDPPPPPSHFR
ncbi:MAG: hypothetical protein GY696_04315, partial [Gammaproteobacteria bacterium]|nr:hypothetical protein [Gammaproteobacteria bacterium]